MTDRRDETYKNSFCTALIDYLIKIDAIDKWKIFEWLGWFENLESVNTERRSAINTTPLSRGIFRTKKLKRMILRKRRTRGKTFAWWMEWQWRSSIVDLRSRDHTEAVGIHLDIPREPVRTRTAFLHEFIRLRRSHASIPALYNPRNQFLPGQSETLSRFYPARWNSDDTIRI